MDGIMVVLGMYLIICERSIRICTLIYASTCRNANIFLRHYFNIHISPDIDILI